MWLGIRILISYLVIEVGKWENCVKKLMMENEIKWVPEIGVGEDPVEFTLFNLKKKNVGRKVGPVASKNESYVGAGVTSSGLT